MAFRTFAEMKIQSTNTPQPMVGSWITAGVDGPTNRALTLTLGTMCGSGNDATQIFKASEWVLLIDPNGTNAERCWLTATSGNTVTLSPYEGTTTTLNTHVNGVFGTGTFIMPSQMTNAPYCQPKDGNTGDIWVGNAYNFSPTLSRIMKLTHVSTGTQPIGFGATAGVVNNFPISELWVYGTANDLYTPSFLVI